MNRTIDKAVGESGGNGGDIQKVGNDLAVVYGRENHVYMGFFGGNVEESTPAVDNPNRKAKDYWANSLLFKNDLIRQYNSTVERTLKEIQLNSAGRIKLENAAKYDLLFLTNQGVQVTVSVTFPALNTVKIDVRTIYTDGERRVTIVTFNRKGSDGDFFLEDFSDDFY